MAAILTITTPNLDVDGTMISMGIAGGVAPYSPGSGVTKIKVHNVTDGIVFYLAASVIASTTISASLAGYIPAGKTITVDIDASSNLTDSLGNTALGQTGVAGTNNSTKTGTSWPRNYAGIGTTLQGIDGGTGGISCLYEEFQATGTDCNLLFRDQTAGHEVFVSVDGGSVVSTGVISTGSGVTTCFPAYVGLANTTHTVVARIGNTNLTLQADIVQTTSATPPTLLATFGHSYSLNGPNYITVDGCPFVAGGGVNDYSGWEVGYFPGLSARFRATTSAVRFVVGNASGGAAAIDVDLQRRAAGSISPWQVVGRITLTSSVADYMFTPTISGLDDTQQWEYSVVTNGQHAAWRIVGVCCVSPTAVYNGGTSWTGQTINETALASNKYIICFGDSESAGYTLAHWHESYPYKLQLAMGVNCFAWAFPGAPVARAGSGFTTLAVHSADFATQFPNRPLGWVFFGMSVNDIIDESGAPVAGFITGCTTILNNAYAAWPVPGIITGIDPDKNDTTHRNTDAMWQTARTNSGSHFPFWTSTLTVNTLVDPVDGADHLNASVDGLGIHLNQSGNSKSAAFLAPRLQSEIFGASGMLYVPSLEGV